MTAHQTRGRCPWCSGLAVLVDGSCAWPACQAAQALHELEDQDVALCALCEQPVCFPGDELCDVCYVATFPPPRRIAIVQPLEAYL